MFGVSAGVREPGNSVSIVIWRRIARSGVRISVKEIDFLHPEPSNSTFGPPKAPIQQVPTFSEIKAAGAWCWPVLSRDVKNQWSHTSTPRIRVHALDMGLLSLFHHMTLWPAMWPCCAGGIVGHVPGRRVQSQERAFLVTFLYVRLRVAAGESRSSDCMRSPANSRFLSPAKR